MVAPFIPLVVWEGCLVRYCAWQCVTTAISFLFYSFFRVTVRIHFSLMAICFLFVDAFFVGTVVGKPPLERRYALR
jgi:hypothetical protein